jgi:mono/diheme cytochrome c family protein
MKFFIPSIVVAVALSACSEPARQAQLPADSVAIAAALLTPESFDTIYWAEDTAAVNRGAIVWQFSCQKCHGIDGRGDGGFVLKGDTLRPPSLVHGEWRYADDLADLRRQVYVGTDGGMPHWGLVGLKLRDVDAVGHYIHEVLRAR